MKFTVAFRIQTTSPIITERSLEEENVCTVLYLDIAQAFDKIWHEEIVNKLNKMLPQKASTLS